MNSWLPLIYWPYVFFLLLPFFLVDLLFNLISVLTVLANTFDNVCCRWRISLWQLFFLVANNAKKKNENILSFAYTVFLSGYKRFFFSCSKGNKKKVKIFGFFFRPSSVLPNMSDSFAVYSSIIAIEIIFRMQNKKFKKKIQVSIDILLLLFIRLDALLIWKNAAHLPIWWLFGAPKQLFAYCALLYRSIWCLRLCLPQHLFSLANFWSQYQSG